MYGILIHDMYTTISTYVYTMYYDVHVHAIQSVSLAQQHNVILLHVYTCKKYIPVGNSCCR